MMPLSYQNIGFTAIIVMVSFLVIVEVAKYFKKKTS
jgi:hypothetical protein